MISNASRWSVVSCPLNSSSVMPTKPFMGVRSSCEMVARKLALRCVGFLRTVTRCFCVLGARLGVIFGCLQLMTWLAVLLLLVFEVMLQADCLQCLVTAVFRLLDDGTARCECGAARVEFGVRYDDDKRSVTQLDWLEQTAVGTE